MLKPDADLKKIVNNGPNDKDTGDIFNMIPDDVKNFARANEKMVLNPVSYSHIKRDGNYFTPHGSSILDRVMKDIMYRDKLREAQFAVASRQVSPTEHWTVGEAGDPADPSEITDLRNVLGAMWTDPNRAIVTHHAVHANLIGGPSNILQLGAEFDRIDATILAGLIVSRQFLS